MIELLLPNGGIPTERFKPFVLYRAKSNRYGSIPLYSHLFQSFIIADFLCGLLDTKERDKIFKLVSVVCLLHDVGKAWRKQQLVFDSDDIGQELQVDYRHEVVSEWLYRRYCKERNIEVSEVACFLIRSHHEKTYDEFKWKRFENEILGDDGNVLNEDKHWVSDCFCFMDYVFSSVNFEKKYEKCDLDLSLAIVEISDWMASNNKTEFGGWFDSFSDINDIERIIKSIEIFKKIEILNLDIEKPLGVKVLNEIQKVCLDVVKKNGAGLYLIEGDAGIGKTIVAEIISYILLKEKLANGVFFSTPRCLSSTKIHESFSKYISEITGEGTNLIHSKILKRESKEINEWFLSNRRGLLTPFGVGTIDQLMMSVMNVKFSCVRKLGLYKKVLIIDEIHDCDGYMLGIIKALISEALAQECSVVIMTATLSSRIKKQILGNKDFSRAYPLITYQSTDKSVLEEYPVTPERVRKYKIETDVGDRALISGKIKDVVDQNRFVLMICNTVESAQEYYNILKSIEPSGMIHAAFLCKDKEELQEKWTSLLGSESHKNGKNPKSGVLISTQILEQSVNISGCEIFLEHTSVNYTLQRIARIHRFDQGDHIPTVHIILSDYMKVKYRIDESMYHCVGSSEKIYGNHLLYRTYHKVVKKFKQNLLVTPDMTRDVIDIVDSAPDINDNDIDYETSRRYYDSFVLDNSTMYLKSKSAIKKAGVKREDNEETCGTRLQKVRTFCCVLCDDVDVASWTATFSGSEVPLDGKSTKILIENSVPIQDWRGDLEKAIALCGTQDFLSNKKVDLVLTKSKGGVNYPYQDSMGVRANYPLPFIYDKTFGLIKKK